MIVCIYDVLTAEEIQKLRAEAALLPFVPASRPPADAPGA